MNTQTTSDFIKDQLDKDESEDIIALQLSQIHNIPAQEAKILVDQHKLRLALSSNSSNSSSSFKNDKKSKSETWARSTIQSNSNSNNVGFDSQRKSSSVSSSLSVSSTQEKQLVAEKSLIKMRAQKERKKLGREEAMDDFMESKKLGVCKFEQCIDQTLDAETFKQLSILASKNRTQLLYYLYIGLDLDRIYLLMHENGVKPDKVSRKIEKLTRENHPIMMKYSIKNVICHAYGKKTDEIAVAKKDSGILDKIFKFLSRQSESSSDKKQSTTSSSYPSQSIKGNKDAKKGGQYQSNNSTTKEFDLSTLQNDDDIMGKFVQFEHDDNRNAYVMKTTGSYNGQTEVTLSQNNYDFIAKKLNGKKMPPLISGKVDWKHFSNSLQVGARCTF